jgi:lipopolysaccharide export system protein LptA
MHPAPDTARARTGRAARFLLLALALPGLALPSVVLAKSSDRKAPMDVDAGSTDATLTENGDTILSGGVTITQGTLEVKSDQAVIHRKNDEMSQVVLTGSPATLKQVNDNGEPMNARAAKIVYTLDSDLVVLTGGVVIEQTRGNMRGESVTYDLKTGRLNGGGGGGRVKMTILPKNKS